MNDVMFAMLVASRSLTFFLVLLVLAGLAGGLVLLAVWLLRRKQAKLLVNPPVQPPEPPKPQPSTCPRCGTPLPAESPQGLCPRCVMGVGLATQTEATGEYGPHGTKVVKPPPSPAEIAKNFPQLEILDCLGRGGMGVVYKARQPRLNRLVALKILAPEKGADPKFAERFLREAQALARLSHPNIVTVHDFGEADGMFYLLMEYVDGATLRQLLREGRMKPETALTIVPKICDALQFAHEQGVVHRDIKPENVLLDKQGRVKIADFGIAKIVTGDQPQQTITQDQILGTPHYMAPEQVEHPQTVDHRADIYSLGVVFYEMLTGELPLGKFQPPSKKVQVDVRLDEVVLHTLEKAPERRYQHVSEVKTDVEHIAHTPPPVTGSSRREEAQTKRADGGRQKAEEDQSLLTSAATIRNEVKAPASWLVATGILNWVTIPFVVAVMLPWASRSSGGTGSALFALLAALFLSSAMILAGLKMKRLEAYSLAVIGSFLAIFITPGNIIGLPVGIWCLVTLFRRDVREAFAKVRMLPPETTPPRGGGAWKSATAIAVVTMILLLGLLGGVLWLRTEQRSDTAKASPGLISELLHRKLRNPVQLGAQGQPIATHDMQIWSQDPSRPEAVTFTLEGRAYGMDEVVARIKELMRQKPFPFIRVQVGPPAWGRTEGQKLIAELSERCRKIGFINLSFHYNLTAAPDAEVPADVTFGPVIERDAIWAAQAWLALVDKGEYGESWKQAATLLRGAVPENDWARSMEIFRQPLGGLVSRKLKTSQRAAALPGAPDGSYVIMQFDASFTGKKTAVETVTFALEKDGQWRVAGYFIE